MPAEDFIIKNKRKKYRFARFGEAPNCFEVDDWDSSLLPKRPLVLEVGGGTGLFSVEQAKRALEQFFVVVDVKADRLQRGAHTALENRLKNIIFIRMPAWKLSLVFSAHSIHTIWVTFPDPYPKRKSAKHRLTHPTFLRHYRNLLEREGTLFFKTDSHALFDWSLEQLVAEKWRITHLTYDLHASPMPEDTKVTTTYEERFLAEGLTTHFVAALPGTTA